MSRILTRPILHAPLAVPSGHGVLSAALRVLVVAANRLLTWRERARQRAGLAEMDDRMLADIGITRAEALRETDKPFWTL